MERTDLLNTMDAMVWANEFMVTKQRLGDAAFDHAMMLGWFANAIMAGYDHKAADHRREVEAIKADALDVSNQQRKQVADLRGQLEAERDVQHALTDIIAEERAKLEAARATAQRAPLESETVCHACDGSGWVERGW